MAIHGSIHWSYGLILSILLAPCAWAQAGGHSMLRKPLVPEQKASAPVAPPATVTEALESMADRAGVIFAGQVTAIRQPQGASGQIEITFHVEQAVLGCVSGVSYTLREWAGLWTSNPHRYRLGERLLLFLHAPGPGGLSSPVGGQAGAIPITVSSTVAGPETTDTGAPDPSVDLRWVEARVLRQTDSPEPQARSAARPIEDTERKTSAGSLQSVLSLLNAWEAEGTHAAP
ncbi:MAG TPA: hypothetical protein VGC07_00775 [Granulicella sp.]